MRIIVRVGDLPTAGNVLIFGAGDGGRIVWRELSRRPKVNILGFIDNQKTGSLNGHPIHRPSDVLPPPPGTLVIIASMFAREIAIQLKSMGVEEMASAAPFLFNHIQARQLRQRKWSIIPVLLELAAAFLLPVLALIARFRSKPIDVGIGPECLINNRYHKKSLIDAGYTAETFVNGLTHVTNDFDHVFKGTKSIILTIINQVRIFWLSASRYKILYIYFTGCPFRSSYLIWKIEPFLYYLSGTRIVVMPYGQDIQDFTRGSNLPLKHATTVDYPYQNRRRHWVEDRIDLWTHHADHVISGCDWVDYMYHWDSLLPAHFTIDTGDVLSKVAPVLVPSSRLADRERIRIVHTPNHRTIKGTRHILAAVERLRQEGLPLDLVVVEAASNQAVLEQIAQADLVIDQLVIGWYAMVAIEAMTMGKPVICFIRSDLRALYEGAEILREDELPLISATPSDLVDILRYLVLNRDALRRAGTRGPAFVAKHHSLDRMGAVFSNINRSLGIWPSPAREVLGDRQAHPNAPPTLTSDTVGD